VKNVIGFAALLTLSVSTVISVAGQKRPLTIYIAGDSTAARKLPEKRPETGWGEMLQQHFDEKKVVVDDRAQNGRSTKTFISEGRWQAIVDVLQPGDLVFVEFGHNDESKEKGERYTPPEDFRTNLTRFVVDVRSKKGIIVLMTPVARRKFDKGGKLIDTHGEYPDIVRSVAAKEKVPLIDMLKKTSALLTSYGPDKSRTLFLQLKAGENPNYPNGIEDNTHSNPLGAEENAKLVVEGIREQKLSVRKYLKK
jgi:lysophospholipase L1-like esterase